MPSESPCVHCGSDCGNHPIIWNNQSFCCRGCQQVYQLLNESKLQQYYSLTELPGVKVDEHLYNDKYAFLDKSEIQQQLYEFREGNYVRVTFYIPTIHCVSCIWLLEHLNRLNAGIKQTSVNFVSKSYTVGFNVSEISLRQLVELLASIHYIPDLSLQSIEKKSNKPSDKALLYKMGVAGFMAGNIMLFSLPQYFNGRPLDESLGSFFIYFSYVLSLPVVFYCGNDYLISAWAGLRKRLINIDFPIALGVLTLFTVSTYQIITKTGQGYCDSLSGLIFFLLVGKWYQSKTYEALAFDRDYKSYFPIAVTRITEGTQESVLLKEIRKGDVLYIRSKELIPTDSVLLSGDAFIDYSFVSGESIPIRKDIGDVVYAGGIQSQGSITIRVEKEVNQSHLTQLWNQSETSGKQTKTLQSIIDRMSVYFTLAIVGLALGGFLWHWQAGNLSLGVLVFTSVLIITCPCALALAVPFTFGNTMRKLGQQGVYIKNTQVIEKLTRIDTIVFDKTGTITIPDESDVKFIGSALSADEIQMVASIVKQSAHPLSGAIAKLLADVETSKTSGFVEIPGKGMYAKVLDCDVKLGAKAYVMGDTENENFASSKVYLSIDNQTRGYFSIGNKYREGFAGVIAELKKHYKLCVLSGDNDAERENLSRLFPNEELHFNQQPVDKRNFILALQQSGRNVLMVGDGLNDAGAFMQSNVAVSIADDVYHFSPAGDAIIEACKFEQLHKVIHYSKQALLVVKMSFVISFVYNAIGLYFALLGTFTPVIGAILMPISSVSVVAFATLGTGWLAKRSFK